MKSLLSYLFTLFIAFQLSAQPKPVQYAETANSLLWEISGQDLKQPSYLFGTYHFAGKNFLDTLAGVHAAFLRSETVVGEIVLENEMKLAMQMMPLMTMKDTTLDKLLKPAEYKEVNDYLLLRPNFRSCH